LVADVRRAELSGGHCQNRRGRLRVCVALEEVLRKADIALSAPQGPGRGRTAVRELDLLERELRKAIDADMILLFYQPPVDLTPNTIVAIEVSPRGRIQPTLGKINPARFIPVAEESGLINELSLRLASRGLSRR
jgi:predicted signal transduction protein with EAL and GGDEF domain